MTDGEHYVQKWRPVHEMAVTMHFMGKSNLEIAAALDRSENWVSGVIGDPRAQKYIRETTKKVREKVMTRVEDKMVIMAQKAIENLAQTILAEPGNFNNKNIQLWRHRDKISQNLLEMLGFGKDGPKGGSEGVNFDRDIQERIADAFEMSERAVEIQKEIDEAEDAEVVTNGKK